MANFQFTVADLMSADPTPFAREQTKQLTAQTVNTYTNIVGQHENVGQPLRTSQSYNGTRATTGAGSYNPNAGANTLAIGDMLMGAPIYAPQTSQLTTLQTSLNSLSQVVIANASGVVNANSGSSGSGSSSSSGGTTTGGAPNVSVATPTVDPATELTPLGTKIAQAIVAQGLSFVGKVPYVWGGSTPSGGFDCSGLVYYLFAQQNLYFNNPPTKTISRGTAQTEFAYGPLITTSGSSVADLNTNDFIIGDLLFFRPNPSSDMTHVGIYIGGGQMLNAPSTGSDVRIDKNWNPSFYPDTFVGATRPLWNMGYQLIATPTGGEARVGAQ